jgi:glycerophosphoryl diester phosphodiesterase family protein
VLENLRPRGVGEILDAAVALYRARFGPLVRLTVLVVLPVQLLNVLITLSTRPEDVTFGATGPTPVYDSSRAFWVPLAGTVVMNVVLVLSTAFATAAVMQLVADTYLDGPTTGTASAHLALRRLPAVLGLGAVVSIVVILATFLCVLPGVFLQVAWVVAMPALLLENKRIGEALGRSLQLTKRRWWQCFAVHYVGSILTAVVTFALTLAVVGGIHVAVHGTEALAIAQGVAGAITATLTTPFVAAAIIVLYFDLRVRAEGFDIQMALRDMDRRRAGAAPVTTA